MAPVEHARERHLDRDGARKHAIVEGSVGSRTPGRVITDDAGGEASDPVFARPGSALVPLLDQQANKTAADTPD